MALSSFGKILTVLNLFSVSRPIINVDIISTELGLSQPTSYRYLKELVSAGLLQRLSGTSGDYTLGSQIAVLDYISRNTDPLLQISIPFMQDIVERTEFCCILTQLNAEHCIDLYGEVFKNLEIFSYGRGCPRPVYLGSSPKVIISQLSKTKIIEYYERFSVQLAQVNFASSQDEFLQKMKSIKKQGYYFSNGEFDPNLASLSVPVKFSAKDHPLALTLLASKNRFEFVDLKKMVDILKQSASQIEQQCQSADPIKS